MIRYRRMNANRLTGSTYVHSIIDIIQHCKLVTWRAYYRRSVDKENTSEISCCITYLYISESGGTVPMRGLINPKG